MEQYSKCYRDNCRHTVKSCQINMDSSSECGLWRIWWEILGFILRSLNFFLQTLVSWQTRAHIETCLRSLLKPFSTGWNLEFLHTLDVTDASMSRWTRPALQLWPLGKTISGWNGGAPGHGLSPGRSFLEVPLYSSRAPLKVGSAQLALAESNTCAGPKCLRSQSRISRWIIDTIMLAFSYLGQQRPMGVRAHSTRGIASSWAWPSGVSIAETCVAAGWDSPSTFVRFYHLDVPALQAQVLSP